MMLPVIAEVGPDGTRHGHDVALGGDALSSLKAPPELHRQRVEPTLTSIHASISLINL